MYRSIARFYDELTIDIDYEKYAIYLDKIIKRYNKNASMLLDIGCGTGNLTLQMKQLGYDVTGLDVSAAMLERCYKKNKDILWLHQDVVELELYGTYDVFISFLDTINHIKDKRQLKKTFQLIFQYLNPGGMFIFDINTPYKFEHIYKDNVFYMIDEHLTYIWENSYHRKNKICDMDITFFEKSGKNYKRYDDYHCERMYEFEELEKLAETIGFKVEGIFKDKTLRPVSEHDLRAFFVLTKEK